MRILITNDDGINAPGLAVLKTIATQIAGSDGEVWTVAPTHEQSGVGHCISYIKPMMVTELDARRFAIEGTPADCVLAGICDIMPTRPDLMLAGVNRGNNTAQNTLYSGTIGAAMEAALQGIQAIALSQFYGPQNADLADTFEAANMTGAALIKNLLDNAIWDDADYRLFYNVNFPPVPGNQVKGQRVVAQGFRRETFFGVEPHLSPSGRKYFWINGGPQHLPTGPDTNVTANLDGYISITPMRCDLTDHVVLPDLKGRIE